MNHQIACSKSWPLEGRGASNDGGVVADGGTNQDAADREGRCPGLIQSERPSAKVVKPNAAHHVVSRSTGDRRALGTDVSVS